MDLPEADLLATAMSTAAEALLVLDDRGRILFANEKAAEVFRLPVARLVGEELRRFSPLSDAEYASSWSALKVSGEAASSGPLARLDGSRVQIDFRAFHDGATGRVTFWFHATDARPSSDMIRAEIALRAVLGNAPVVLYATDEKGVFTYSAGQGLASVGRRSGEIVGQSALELFGSNEFGSHDGTLLHGRDVLRRCLEGEPFIGWSRVGDAFYDNWINPSLDPEGVVRGLIGVATVATERKRLERQLQISERLASVGALAAGVAHELNNPLAYVMANLQYIRDQLSSGRERDPVEAVELERALSDSLSGAERMRLIIRDLKSLSRMDDGARRPVVLAKVLDSALSIATHELSGRAVVVRELPDDLPKVLGSEARLGQVFLNLIVNAAQAIAEKGDRQGELRIVAQRASEGFVEVSVRDNGTGIREEHLSRIFDPFFSTKPVGAGTGLGLPISVRILEELGGRLEVESKLGFGTTFRVRLPIADAEAEVAHAEKRPQEPKRGRAKVLIIDDDARFAESLARVLDQETRLARSRAEAMALFEQDPAFDLVACDVMMPDVNGPTLAAELVARWPALEGHVVLMTGGAYTREATDALEASRFPQLEKPFDVAKLQRFIRAPRIG